MLRSNQSASARVKWVTPDAATSPQKRSGMARDVKGSHSFTFHPRAYPRTMPAFASPAKAGPHLQTPDGWKAELA